MFTIDARVLPRVVGLYTPNVAYTFILVTRAVCIVLNVTINVGLACYLI